jgi:hypothetical protein
MREMFKNVLSNNSNNKGAGIAQWYSAGIQAG